MAGLREISGPTRTSIRLTRVLRPGMNGSLDIIVSRIPAAISIPAKAVFTSTGNRWRTSVTKGAAARGSGDHRP